MLDPLGLFLPFCIVETVKSPHKVASYAADALKFHVFANHFFVLDMHNAFSFLNPRQ